MDKEEYWYFQQDNPSAHSALHTRERFMDNKIANLEWPAKSPNLNIIENVGVF